jgi:amino acid transporter
MADTAIAKPELFKGIRWYDGFVVALANPGFLIGSLGYSIGALGGWGAALLWTISMLMGVGKNWIYAEMASMFPDKPGGIALYAHEGWRRYFSLAGPIATFGYWFAWSTVLSIFGLVVGSLIQSQWFPDQKWTFSDGFVDIGLPHLIAAALIIMVWAFNIFGIRVAVWFAYVTGALLMIPLAVFIILPFVTGDWHASNLHFGTATTPFSLKLALVWLYIMGWSSYGVETCAAFAPEYKDTVRDTNLALKSAACSPSSSTPCCRSGLPGPSVNKPRQRPRSILCSGIHPVGGRSVGVDGALPCRKPGAVDEYGDRRRSTSAVRHRP